MAIPHSLRNIYLALVVGAAWPTAPSALALGKVVDVEPEDVAIYLTAIKSAPKNDIKTILKSWTSACDLLGKNLQIGKGAQGTGVFINYSCFDKSKYLSGPGAKNRDQFRWNIEAEFQGDSIDYTVFFDPEHKHKAPAEAAFSIKFTDQTMKALNDPEVANLIALKLVDIMPMSMAIQVPTKDLTKIDPQPDLLKRSAPLPTGPKKLLLYQLQYDIDRQSWIPKLVGSAVNKTKNTKPPSSDGPAKKYHQKHLWAVKLATKDLKPGTYLWAQNAKGRGREEKPIGKSLDAALTRYGLSMDAVLGALIDTLASGYGGIRYGYSLASGDPLVSKSTMVSMFTEVRGGPVEGLRWYWDLSPKHEILYRGENLYFGWSRPTFGWSFGMDIPDFIISRIDAVPKIGWMSLEANLGIENKELDTFTTSPFLMKNALSVGIEIGIEEQTDWFLLRLWGASDGAGFFSFLTNVPGAGAVSSIRGGIDTYWELFNLGQIFDVSLLVFAAGERISLSKNATAASEDGTVEASDAIEGLKYNLGFVGLGMTLKW